MSKLSLMLAGAVLVAGCSGKTEIGGDGAPSKQPASPAATVAPAVANDHQHLLLVVEVEPDAHHATLLDSHFVDLPLPTRRMPESGPWRVEVLSSSGAVLYAAELPDAGALRGEFAGKDGQMESVNARKAKTALSVRLPILADAATVRIIDTSPANAPPGGVELGRVTYPKATP
jgi:hypothetical protein